MKSETCGFYHPEWLPGLLLLIDPRQFFSDRSSKKAPVWRYLLVVSLIAAVFNYLAGRQLSDWFGPLVFFINAVGMTCIFAGCVFIFVRTILGNGCALGRVFSICVYASLGPILLSWIPGAIWILNPWKWWVSAVGLSVCIPAGSGKTAMIVGLAVGSMYVMFRMVLFIV